MASGGHVGLNNPEVLWFSFLFLMGAVVMRGAGCVINDLWDADLDGRVERTRQRPIPSGQVVRQHAFVFLSLLLLIGLFILSYLPVMTVLLGFLSLPLIVFYPVMKRITFWPQAFLGVTFNFGILMGWAAVSGTLSFSTVLLYLGAIFWTLAYDTVYAFQDKKDDLAVGVKSTALKFGENGKSMVAVFYALALFFIGCAGFYMGAGLFFIVGIWCSALYAGWEFKHWKTDSQKSCLAFFKSNTIFGILILFSILLIPL